MRPYPLKCIYWKLVLPVCLLMTAVAMFGFPDVDMPTDSNITLGVSSPLDARTADIDERTRINISWTVTEFHQKKTPEHRNSLTQMRIAIPALKVYRGYPFAKCLSLLKLLQITISPSYWFSQGFISFEELEKWCFTLDALLKCKQYTYCAVIHTDALWEPESLLNLTNEIYADKFVRPISKRYEDGSESVSIYVGGNASTQVIDYTREYSIHSPVDIMLNPFTEINVFKDRVMSHHNQEPQRQRNFRKISIEEINDYLNGTIRQSNARQLLGKSLQLRKRGRALNSLFSNISNSVKDVHEGRTVGIVLPYHKERRDLLEIMAKQVSLRDEHILLIQDSGPEFGGFDNVVLHIHHRSHQRIGKSLLEGYEWFYQNGYAIICNVDSDVLTKPDWMIESQRLLLMYPNDIVSGFNEKNHLRRCVVKSSADHYVKKCGGGIHYCFTRKTYESFIKPVLLDVEKSGDLNYWDAGIVEAALKANRRIISPKPSRIQHMGYKGFTDKGRKFRQLAPDYVLSPAEVALIKPILPLRALWWNARTSGASRRVSWFRRDCAVFYFQLFLILSFHGAC